MVKVKYWSLLLYNLHTYYVSSIMDKEMGKKGKKIYVLMFAIILYQKIQTWYIISVCNFWGSVFEIFRKVVQKCVVIDKNNNRCHLESVSHCYMLHWTTISFLLWSFMIWLWLNFKTNNNKANQSCAKISNYILKDYWVTLVNRNPEIQANIVGL